MSKSIALTFLFAFAPWLKAAEIEFVESAPEETVYGSTLSARPGPVWLDMINGASKTLDFEEFYIADKLLQYRPLMIKDRLMLWLHTKASSVL